jgi:hypothetical protein
MFVLWKYLKGFIFTSLFSDFSYRRPTSNPTVKRLLLPPEFFEFISDVPGKLAGYYNKCTFPGCKPKKDKNGQDKYLVVYNDTRSNGKRHFCVRYLLPLCYGTCTITSCILVGPWSEWWTKSSQEMERCCKCYERAVRTTAKLKLYTENLEKGRYHTGLFEWLGFGMCIYVPHQ